MGLKYGEAGCGVGESIGAISDTLIGFNVGTVRFARKSGTMTEPEGSVCP
jgi:hypothetical protein